jgi:SMI1-KNR4 cell-wall
MAYSNVLPAPSAERLDWFDKVHRVRLPPDYREFLQTANGAKPERQTFDADRAGRVVERFLPILEKPADHPLGDYDITIVITQLGERISSDADALGWQLIPIAALFAGDFLCLDFRGNAARPQVVVWDHERSRDFAPVVTPVADSFSAFLSLLR